MFKKTAIFIAVSIFVMQAGFADEESDIKIRPGGFAYYQVGQIVRQSPKEAGLTKGLRFDQHFNGRMTLDAVIKEHLRIVVGAEAKLGININDEKRQISFIFKEAQGCYSFGDPENSFLQITAGYFPFKYNPEARNLGEYLFRTGTYPGYVITDFNNAKARLMGFKVTSNLFNSLQINALFTSEFNVNPFFDYSLSFLASYKLPLPVFDIGAGIIFERLIPVVKDRTTKPINIVLDEDLNPVMEDGDTLRYTLKGTKLMGRLSLDFKQLLPFKDIFGPEDGKVYGEMAILGTKNYGTYYNDVGKRIPLMWGVNIPCFKILDVLSLEWEYYPSDTAQKLDIPGSGDPFPAPMPVDIKKSDLKWSLYTKKTLTRGFALIGLIGRDHYRSVDPGGNYDRNERMNEKGDWHYKFRIMFSF